MTSVFDPTNLMPEQVPGLTDQQLNDAAAQLVMGWFAYSGRWRADKGVELEWSLHADSPWGSAPAFRPATDLNHAAMLIQRMRESGYVFELRTTGAFPNGPWGWACLVASEVEGIVVGNLSLALAITRGCVRAALRGRGARK